MTSAAGLSTLDTLADGQYVDGQSLAIRTPSASLSRFQLAEAVVAAIQWLDENHIAAPQRVAVAIEQPIAELAVLLACEHLSLCCAAVGSAGQAQTHALLEHFDVLITSPGITQPVGIRQIAFSQEEDAGMLTRAKRTLKAPNLVPRCALAASDWVHINASSGSTGKPRVMAISQGLHDQRMQDARYQIRFAEGDRLLRLVPLLVAGELRRIQMALQQGASLLHINAEELPNAGVDHIRGTPMHIHKLLDAWRTVGCANRPKSVAVLGGQADRALRQRALEVLGVELSNSYASNETGMICVALDADGSGEIVNHGEARIVDESGHEVAVGEAGELWFQSNSCVSAYLGPHDRPFDRFSGPWVRTGDCVRKLQEDARRLQWIGRLDGMLLVNGLKLPAAQLEASILSLHGVDAAAAFALTAQKATQNASIGLALVVRTGFDPSRLQEALQRFAPGVTIRAKVQKFKALPRLASGKVDRLTLIKLFTG